MEILNHKETTVPVAAAMGMLVGVLIETRNFGSNVRYFRYLDEPVTQEEAKDVHFAAYLKTRYGQLQQEKEENLTTNAGLRKWTAGAVGITTAAGLVLTENSGDEAPPFLLEAAAAYAGYEYGRYLVLKLEERVLNSKLANFKRSFHRARKS